MNGEPKRVRGETYGGVLQEFVTTMLPPTPEMIARPRYNMPDRRWMAKSSAADTEDGETMAIIPTTKSVFLCDGYTAVQAGKVTLHGLFHTIRPAVGYPHLKDEFCVYVEMSGGLGRFPFWVDIRSAKTGRLAHYTDVRELFFPNRDTILQVVVRIQGCRFDEPGRYIVNLICNNTWVNDTALELL